MARYLVLVSSREAPLETRLERAVFVREGFSVWAYLFGPLWFARHGHWVVALVMGALLAGLMVALSAFNLPDTPRMAIIALVMGLFGLEASSLRALDLRWRGYVLRDVLVGDDLETIERRFFETALSATDAKAPAMMSQSSDAPHVVRHGSPSIIGLFPQQGGRT